MTQHEAALKFLAALQAKYPEIAKDAVCRAHVVYWESGPYGWAIDLDYAIHAEVAPMMAEFGKSSRYVAPKVPTLDALTPPGFYHEACNSYSISMQVA